MQIVAIDKESFIVEYVNHEKIYTTFFWWSINWLGFINFILRCASRDSSVQTVEALEWDLVFKMNYGAWDYSSVFHPRRSICWRKPQRGSILNRSVPRLEPLIFARVNFMLPVLRHSLVTPAAQNDVFHRRAEERHRSLRFSSFNILSFSLILGRESAFCSEYEKWKAGKNKQC